MHIAILGPSYPWRGGIAHYTARLYQALQKSGHQVTLYNFKRLYPELFFPGKTQLDLSQHAFSVPSAQLYDPVDPRSWVKVCRRLFDARPARLIMQWWHPFFAPGYAAIAAFARLMGTQVHMICHNVVPHEHSPVDRSLLRLAYALPTHFIVQSETEARRLAGLFDGFFWPNRPPITVVAHPRYDIFTPSTLPRKHARPKEASAEHHLLFFGLVRPYKGLDLLLDAMAMLPDELDVQLTVAGEFYQDIEVYRQQVEALALTDRVQFKAHYVPNEEVAELFAAADLCVLPYRHATGSGAANVALGCGVPLVMSRLISLQEAFADQPVHWFESGSSLALSEAIQEALRAPKIKSSGPKPSSDDGWQRLVEAITDSASF